MVELRKLRGKSVLVSGSNVENDLLSLYPDLFSKYITQNSVFDAKVFEEDFLTWLDMGIDNTSDIIAVCITPLTATIASNAVINYKDY